jgi:lysophospholipase L1-like esterase
LLPIDRLILPVVFDDLRETGIRAPLLPALRDPETRAALENIEIGRTILEKNSDVAAGDFAALDQTVQESVETGLNDWLNDHFRLWAARPEMRGRLFADLHQYRNAALGITAQTKRKLIRGRYQLNMAALDAILIAASQSGIEAFVYIAPLRNDVEAPYDAGEYAAFKREVEELAARRGAAYANLESTVPGEFWGMKDSTDASGKLEFDFMHFQAPGHALLAEAIENLIDARTDGDPQ